MLSACAGLSGQETAPVDLSGQSVLVLPATTLHKELSPLTRDVSAEVVRQLLVAGVYGLTLGADEMEAVDRAALVDSGSIYEPKVGRFIPLDEGVYLRSLTTQLKIRQEFQVLAVTELVLRDTVLEEQQVTWDGAEETLEFRGVDAANLDRKFMPKQVKALSLRIRLYQDSGRLVMERYAGLSLPFVADFTLSRPNFVLKQPLTLSPQQLRDAVSNALLPVHEGHTGHR